MRGRWVPQFSCILPRFSCIFYGIAYFWSIPIRKDTLVKCKVPTWYLFISKLIAAKFPPCNAREEKVLTYNLQHPRDGHVSTCFLVYFTPALPFFKFTPRKLEGLGYQPFNFQEEALVIFKAEPEGREFCFLLLLFSTVNPWTDPISSH